MLFPLKICFIGMALLLSGCTSHVWIADWKEAFSMISPRNGAASVIVHNNIYVIGGNNGEALSSTEYASIQEDGSLDPWQVGPKLNVERGFMEAVVRGNYIYVAGGGNGPADQNLLHSVERAEILADGSLGPWQLEKNEMVVGRRCNKLLATDKALYAFGGFGGVLLDSVEHAEWQPDGTLGEWQLDPQILTVPRYINTVQKVGDTFFVIGGHRNDGNSIADIEWSRPMENGNLQPWQATTPMRQPRWGHESIAYGNEIYALGGFFGPKYIDSIEHTKVGKDGRLEPWRPTTFLDQPRGTFSLVANKNYTYVIGGAYPDGNLASVVYAERNSAGDYGFWGSREDTLTAQARRVKRDRMAVLMRLPNEGKALAVLHTLAYTYIQVENNKYGLVWIAGPKLDKLKVGDRVGYNEGTHLKGFSSKELQRDFPMVILVAKIQLQ